MKYERKRTDGNASCRDHTRSFPSSSVPYENVTQTDLEVTLVFYASSLQRKIRRLLLFWSWWMDPRTCDLR